jgi:hypothetical protein
LEDIINILHNNEENNFSEDFEKPVYNNPLVLQNNTEKNELDKIRVISQNNTKILRKNNEENSSKDNEISVQNNLIKESTTDIKLNESKQVLSVDPLVPNYNITDILLSEAINWSTLPDDNKYTNIEFNLPSLKGDSIANVTPLDLKNPLISNMTIKNIGYQIGVKVGNNSDLWSLWGSDGKITNVTCKYLAAPMDFILRVKAPDCQVNYQIGVKIRGFNAIWSPWRSNGTIARVTTKSLAAPMDFLLKIKAPDCYVYYQIGVKSPHLKDLWSPWSSNGTIAKVTANSLSGNMTFQMKAKLTRIINISFTAPITPEGSKVRFTVNANYSKNASLTYSFDFQNDGIFDYIGKNNTTSFVWGDDYKGTAVVKVSDGNLSIKANTTVMVTNAQPKIDPFGPIIIDEGHSFNITTNASDPGSDDLNFTWKLGIDPTISNIYYNNKLSPDLYPSPAGIYPFLVNDSINYILPDDGIYNLTLTVTDDDGLNSVYKSKVIVKNVAPTVKLKIFSNKTNNDAKLAIRIAGEKWHDVRVELYKNGTEIANGSLTRYPGSPNEQMLNFSNYTLNPSNLFTTIIRYTPNDDPINGKPNGATPCWVLLKLSNGKLIKLHHTFKVKHKDTHIWRVNITKILSSDGNSTNVSFSITAIDPGADDFIFYLDFGDGTNITKFYPNKNQTYPVMINITLIHNYISHGKLTVTLIAEDDDGGITLIKFSIDVG